MAKQWDASALLAEFAENVAAQTDAIWRGNRRTVNKYAKRYIAAYDKLFAMGEAGFEALCVLLAHERPDVRVMAATFLLGHRTAKALDVLRKAASGSGLVAFGASEAIKRWEEGSWTLDPK